MVERPTEKLCAVLTWVPVSGAARDFSPRINCLCILFHGVRTAPCGVACINICTHVNNHKHWQSYRCLNTWIYYTHLQEWVALLRRLCLTRVRQHEFPAKEVLKKQKSLLHLVMWNANPHRAKKINWHATRMVSLTKITTSTIKVIQGNDVFRLETLLFLQRLEPQTHFNNNPLSFVISIRRQPLQFGVRVPRRGVFTYPEVHFSTLVTGF